MRIPLDYYRVLGLPIQATAEQLRQSHRDRTQQLPRREFSEAAISARKALIDQAYSLLSEASQRREYDAGFLPKSYDSSDGADAGLGSDGPSDDLADRQEALDSYSPSIELEEPQFVGALLILLELGEYELVLRLSRPYLSNGTLSLKSGRFGDPEIVPSDVVLTVALAYLELGREQWQQGHYENAANSLESGQELLLREGLFANIRGEMQSDLFKLRPYRVLELVLLPDGREEQRRQGIGLLEDMLHDRSGIDGNGDDLSGLSVDDFLRFIQQLRSYLTSAEQQVLFESEARRPSAVATYLAVYALLARGFAQRQPALVRRAKLLLLRLGSHQDVHLEQAVCSLLLGQTEEASRALELSQEFESLAFIREHSQTSPDLLPGLCLYSERWFQTEVFPHFRDLQHRQASLTDYFADEDVQLYLEELSTEIEPAPRPYAAAAWPQARPDLRAANAEAHPEARFEPQELPRTAAGLHVVGAGHNGQAPAGNPVVAVAGVPAGTAILDPKLGARALERVQMLSADSQTNSQLSETRDTGSSSQVPNGQGHSDRSEQLADDGRQNPPEAQRQTARSAIRRPGLPSNLRLDRILLLAALGLLGVMLLGFLFGKLINRPQPAASANAVSTGSGDSPKGTGIEPAFSDFANRQQKAISVGAALTEENAPEVIKSWLDAKTAAMGTDHEIEKLEQILVEPALSQQRTRAEAAKAEDAYWKLTHSKVEIVSVETNQTETSPTDADDQADQPDQLGVDLNSPAADSPAADSGTGSSAGSDANQASVEAIVSEKADFYSDGKLDSNASYDSTVRVRYDLVRQDSEWRIQDMAILE